MNLETNLLVKNGRINLRSQYKNPWTSFDPILNVDDSSSSSVISDKCSDSMVVPSYRNEKNASFIKGILFSNYSDVTNRPDKKTFDLVFWKFLPANKNTMSLLSCSIRSSMWVTLKIIKCWNISYQSHLSPYIYRVYYNITYSM